MQVFPSRGVQVSYYYYLLIRWNLACELLHFLTNAEYVVVDFSKHFQCPGVAQAE